MALQIGDLLQDRYEIAQVMSTHDRGGRYLALDQENNQTVRIREMLDLDAEVFVVRAEALSKRIHPQLVTVLDFFCSDTPAACYLVTEQVPGRRLDTLAPVDEATLYGWMTQVFAAVDYLHGRDVPLVHGALSPANIVITSQDEPVLTDYGFDGAIDPDLPLTHIAAEQLAGETETRSDVYAAGATLYTALSGRVPGEQQVGPPDRFNISSLRRVNPRVNPQVAQVIDKALEHRPEARHESIREFRKAYGRAHTRATHHEAEAASRPGVPVWAWAAAALVLALVAGGLWWWQGRDGASVAAAEPDATSSVVAAVDATTTPRPAPTDTPPQPTRRASSTPPPEPSATPSVTPTLTPTGSPTSPPTRTPDGASPTATQTEVPLAVTEVEEAGAITLAAIDDMPMIFVPEGAFLFGADIDTDPDAQGDEQPQLLVDLPSFWIDQHEVTNAQYFRCIMEGACTRPRSFDSASHADYFTAPEFADYPVLWVTQAQAADYCAWVDRQLPSEMQWEKAARGPDGRLYPWGDDPPQASHANFGLNRADVSLVGSYPLGNSPYGVQDMAGNVAEWIGHLYKANYFAFFDFLTATPDPDTLIRGGVPVIRNGGWNDSALRMRTVSRGYVLTATYADNTIGFRCVSETRP